MMRFLRLAALGLAILPTAVFADTAATPDAGPPGRPQLTDAQRSQMQATMRQSFAQMEQLHVRERTAIIGSLSPAHRQALANIIGQMALAPNPDREAAARQIDAILSQSEVRSVLTAHMQARTAEKSMRDAQRQAFLSVLTPEQRSAMDARKASFEAAHPNDTGRTARDGRMSAMSGRTPDAGHVLLMLSDGGPGHMGMGMGGGRDAMERRGFGGPPGMGGPGPA